MLKWKLNLSKIKSIVTFSFDITFWSWHTVFIRYARKASRRLPGALSFIFVRKSSFLFFLFVYRNKWKAKKNNFQGWFFSVCLYTWLDYETRNNSKRESHWKFVLMSTSGVMVPFRHWFWEYILPIFSGENPLIPQAPWNFSALAKFAKTICVLFFRVSKWRIV